MVKNTFSVFHSHGIRFLKRFFRPVSILQFDHCFINIKVRIQANLHHRAVAFFYDCRNFVPTFFLETKKKKANERSEKCEDEVSEI